jgi:hypothetical protein
MVRTNPLSKSLSFLISFKEIYAVLTSLAISNALLSFYDLINHNLLNVLIKIFEEDCVDLLLCNNIHRYSRYASWGDGCYLE